MTVGRLAPFDGQVREALADLRARIRDGKPWGEAFIAAVDLMVAVQVLGNQLGQNPESSSERNLEQ